MLLCLHWLWVGMHPHSNTQQFTKINNCIYYRMSISVDFVRSSHSVPLIQNSVEGTTQKKLTLPQRVLLILITNYYSGRYLVKDTWKIPGKGFPKTWINKLGILCETHGHTPRVPESRKLDTRVGSLIRWHTVSHQTWKISRFSEKLNNKVYTRRE